MARVSPYHSTNTNDPPVYHDDSQCPRGKKILPKNKKSGTGGYPKCKDCR